MNRLLKAVVSFSERRDGTRVYTATLERMPGIVVEAESEEKAIEELIGVVSRLRESAGIPDEVFEDAPVESWSWDSYSDRRDNTLVSGPDQRTFSLPRKLALA